MSSVAATKEVEIPDVIVDRSPKHCIVYEKSDFLGKGGFAKCFVLKNQNGQIVAGKIVPKALLKSSSLREKMAEEISIHNSLSHDYIVKMFGYFEDSDFVYITLELCRCRSLMELHKRRKIITEPETRYFLRQILLGVQYLHKKMIIHRDLKLGNIFLNDNIEIKIGDFGLATKVEFVGEKKTSLCGTPNYIAPEVLLKTGYSFEADIWSIGCMMYVLLVGKPPFETNSLPETYKKIKETDFHVPSKIGPLAKKLIINILQGNPEKRPSIERILSDVFMTMGYLPPRLPFSCLTMAPRFDTKANETLIALPGSLTEHSSSGATGSGSTNLGLLQAVPKDCYLSDLQKILQRVISSQTTSHPRLSQEDEAEEPKLAPMIWISKWVDHSKYGFGYSLSDDSIGVKFNDKTKLLLLKDGSNIHYIDGDGDEFYFTLTNYPSFLEKKVSLLIYFRDYMKKHLVQEGDELSRIPSLKAWFRTSRAVVMQLTNGTFQINFFNDHTKVILCPLLCGVTYIDKHRKSRTYSLDLIQQYGCSGGLFSRLSYTLEKVNAALQPTPTGNYVSTGLRKGNIAKA